MSTNFRSPDRRTALELELSRRSRALLAKESDAYSGDVQVTGHSVMSTQGDLLIERTADYRVVYMESPNQTVIRTGLESELAQAIDAIKRHTVLDDLANA